LDPLPEFPIGLSLVYDKETDYWMSATHTWIDTYDVVRWNATDHSRVIIDNGYLRNDPWEYTSYEISLPSWDYEYYSEEYNQTISGWIYPLWIDVSNWTVDDNVSIPAMSENSQVYQVQGEVGVGVDAGSIKCWVVKTEYIGANDWEYRCTLRYDTQYGILIKVNSVRDPGFEDMGNYATHESILTSSNIMNHLLIPPPPPPQEPYQFSIDGLLILGIIVEVIVIVGIAAKGIPRK